jgi:preprotein translocase subunit SecG
MYETILMIHVVISAALIAMVLLQQGKGAGMGALGGGGSNTLFGSQGSANFMSRTTALLATGFFITSLTLSYMAIRQVKAAKQDSIPVAPAVVKQVETDVPVEIAPAAVEAIPADGQSVPE